ncbi:MAG: hypothetical protein PHP75_08195 [Methylacidiphilaceae bacterium]|nr:hypothetical protein [Candidatus Methylacidiphilaceae bacterium]
MKRRRLTGIGGIGLLHCSQDSNITIGSRMLVENLELQPKGVG